MSEIRPPLAVRFPFDRCPGRLPEEIHNLNEDLFNPKPKAEWKPGETCWYYNRHDKMIHYAVVTSFDPETVMQSSHVFVADLDTEPGKEAMSPMLKTAEAFPSLEELESALYKLPGGN